MLYPLFLWIYGKKAGLDLPPATLKLSDFGEAEEAAIHFRRENVAALYAARMKHDTPQIKLHYDNLFLFLPKFQAFIHFAHDQHTKGCDHLFELTYQYLKHPSTELSRPLNEMIPELFKTWLAHEEDKTLAFFEEEEDGLKDYPALFSLIDIHQATQLRERLHHALEEETHPLHLIHLFKPWVAEPPKVAAALLWLVEKGISNEAILKTGFLHDYFRYHLISLGSPLNPLMRLQTLLNHFPQTQELCALASQKHASERGFNRYSLLGELKEEAALMSLDITSPDIGFTPSPAHFVNLHQIFGDDFLLFAVLFLHQSSNEICRQELIKILNAAPIKPPHLLNISERIATQLPALTSTLSTLFTDETLTCLLASECKSIFYLIEHLPKLLPHLKSDHIRAFITFVKEDSASLFENIAKLHYLLNNTQKLKPGLSQILYEALIDLSLEYPQSMDDAAHIAILQAYPMTPVYVKECIRVLQEQFDAVIAHAQELSEAHYHLIEDEWREIVKNIRVLEQILSCPHHIPKTQYQLLIQIATLYFNHHPVAENFDLFFSYIGIEQAFSDDGLTVYERVLLEFLISIDHPDLRTLVFDKLQSDLVFKHTWKTLKFAEHSLWELSIIRGNTGLMEWLCTQLTPAPQAISNALLLALETQQWRMAKALLDKPYHPSIPLHQSLLKTGAKHGEIKIIEKVLEEGSHLRKIDLEETFKIACGALKFDILDLLLSKEETSPPETTIVKLFNQSILAKCQHRITYLINLPLTPVFKRAIEKAFLDAVENGEIELVKALWRTDDLSPNPRLIEVALHYATRIGHQEIFDFILTKDVIEPKKSLLEQLMLTAIKNRQQTSFLDLKRLSEEKGVLIKYEKLIAETVKSGQDELLGLILASSSPLIHPSILGHGLLLAIQDNRLITMTMLCPYANQSVLEQGFQHAVKHNNLAIVKILFPLLTPTVKFLRFALQRANTSGSESLKAYLRENLESTRMMQHEASSSSVRLFGMKKATEETREEGAEAGLWL